MSDTATPPTVEDQIAAAVAYVRDDLFPPLPEAYGPWLVKLAARARAGEDPDIMLTVPKTVLDTGVVPPRVRREADGAILISLGDALRAMQQEDLLYPEHEQPDTPLEVVTPIVALALANTADAQHWAETYDPEQVTELAQELALGTWTVHVDKPIRVDEQGRIASGLNELLAIVHANLQAPVRITYAYDDGPRPLTWRGPAGAERTTDRD
ncbi:hypothetical protein AB0M39_38125 [Streptomyces sp. NPDC051907]|uniref:hypothetical protein n=1 Tax=Streptomyces sp. NPDC051907 TaxID=3155284 RepID=UPI003435967E